MTDRAAPQGAAGGARPDVISSTALEVRVEDGVATLTLNRPAQGNALNGEMVSALLQAVTDCGHDSRVRCVVLTGVGRRFCSGGDVSEFMKASAGAGVSGFVREQTAILHLAISRFMRLEKPLLVLVNGPAAGAGMSLALAGDIVLAARSARFSTAYSALGLTADGGMSWQLPRLVGMRRAQDLLLSGRPVEAEEALQMGLVTGVVDDNNLAEEGQRRAWALSQAALPAFSEAKRLLLWSFGGDLELQLELEAKSISAAAGSDEFQRRLQAAAPRPKQVSSPGAAA